MNLLYLLLKSESVLCDCLQAHFNIHDLSRRWPSPTTTHTSPIMPDGNYTCAQAAQCHFTNKSQPSVHPRFIPIEKKEFKRSLLYVTQKWECTRMIKCSICWHKKHFQQLHFSKAVMQNGQKNPAIVLYSSEQAEETGNKRKWAFLFSKTLSTSGWNLNFNLTPYS